MHCRRSTVLALHRFFWSVVNRRTACTSHLQSNHSVHRPRRFNLQLVDVGTLYCPTTMLKTSIESHASPGISIDY